MTQEFLLVDGYNIIFAWEELNQLAQENLESARIKLADILCNYQGFKRNEVILVYDGYKFKGNPGSVIHYNNIDIVYTKEAVTADQFIEMVAQQMARKYTIRVATSDATEQIIILGKGATRISAREFQIEVEEVEKSIREIYTSKCSKKQNYLFDHASPEVAKLLEQIRLNEKESE